MYIHIAECDAAGIDPDKIRSIARRLSSAGRDARALGVTIFGGSGSGTLRIHQNPGDSTVGALVLADLDGQYDGGDGGCVARADGLLRGE